MINQISKPIYIILSSLVSPVDFKDVLRLMFWEKRDFHFNGNFICEIRHCQDIYLLKGAELMENCSEISRLFDAIKSEQVIDNKELNVLADFILALSHLPNSKKKSSPSNKVLLHPKLFIHWAKGGPESYHAHCEALQSGLESINVFDQSAVYFFSSQSDADQALFYPEEDKNYEELRIELTLKETIPTVHQFFTRIFTFCAVSNTSPMIISKKGTPVFYRDLLYAWNDKRVKNAIDRLDEVDKHKILNLFKFQEDHQAFEIENPSELRALVYTIIKESKVLLY